jgi:hypothetical protein
MIVAFGGLAVFLFLRRFELDMAVCCIDVKVPHTGRLVHC